MKEIDRRFTICMAVTAVAIAIVATWVTNRPAPPARPSMAQVEAEAQSGGYQLIDVHELFKRYETKPDDTLLIDTRQEWEYRRGYIEGALHFPIESTWWAMWKKKKSLEALLGADRNKTLVFY
jgi:hypothetical protein